MNNYKKLIIFSAMALLAGCSKMHGGQRANLSKEQVANIERNASRSATNQVGNVAASAAARSNAATKGVEILSK